MVHWSFVLLCGLLCVSLTSCTSQPRYVDVGPTYVQGLDTASAPREKQIVEGFAGLKLGLTREEVRSLLGAPDSASPLTTKKTNEFRGWSYHYKLERDAAGKVRHVGVFFDPVTSQLHWAVATNVPGLTDIGGPGGVQ